MRIALLSLAIAMPLSALASPIELTHQGRLLAASGAPLVGEQDLVLSLYDSESPSAIAVWTDTFTVDLNNGVFAVTLGSGSPLDHSVFDGTSLFLGIAVNADPELSRTPISDVPVSAYARTAASVAGGTVSATEVTVGTTTLDSNGISVGGNVVIDPTGTIVASPADLGCGNSDFLVWNGSAWSCGNEADPAFMASAVSSVSATDIAAWDEAHAWGDHSGQYVASELDPQFAASAAAGVSNTDIAQWNEAHGWGDHDGEYLPTTGGTVNGPVTTRNLTVAKSGLTSVVSFPATANDPGSIVHMEDNNTGELWLSSSDDWDVSASNDTIVFGDFSADVRQHVFVANGNAIHEGTVTVDGETLTAARIASWDRPSNGCPSDMDRVAAWCVDDALNPATVHVEAMRACWDAGRRLCEPEVLFACDDSTGTACDTAMDAPTTTWLWTSRLGTDVNDVGWNTNSGTALVTAQTGDNVINEIDYLSRSNSFQYFCCSSPTR